MKRVLKFQNRTHHLSEYLEVVIVRYRVHIHVGIHLKMDLFKNIPSRGTKLLILEDTLRKWVDNNGNMALDRREDLKWS